MHAVECEIWARGPRSTHGECEKQADLKDDVMLGENMTNFLCMHVKQVQQLIN